MVTVVGLVVVVLLAASPPVRAGTTADGDTFKVQAQGAGYGALIGGGTGLVLGGLFGLKAGQPILGVLIGTGIGMVVGVPFGVTKYADDRGGTGQAWGSALGAIAGAAAGVASIYGSQSMKPSPQVIAGGILVVIACVTAGPILGYRLSETGSPAAVPLLIPLTSMTF